MNPIIKFLIILAITIVVVFLFFFIGGTIITPAAITITRPVLALAYLGYAVFILTYKWITELQKNR